MQVDHRARERAEAILQANLDPRFWRIDRLERYAKGSQYEGRASFWNDDVPLHEKAPIIVHPVVASAIASNCDLVLGDGRYPVATTHPGEDDSAFDDRFGLNQEDSEILDRFLKEVQEQARCQTVFTELLETAQHSRTSVAVCRVIDGKLDIETVLAKHCKPTFDATRPSEVTRLEIRYPYIEDYFDENKKQWSCRCMLYRRVIDTMTDTVYLPAMASDKMAEPDAWIVDETKTQAHGFGFCPVVWYKFMPGKSTVAEIDGCAIHERLLDEIDALNFSLSQKHRACLYCADPQMLEIGVDDDENPAPMGRQASMIYLPGDPLENKQWRSGGSADGRPARKRGPGVINRYRHHETKVDYLTLPGDAMKPSEDNARNIEAMIKEALAYVAIDLDKMKIGSDISGRALEWLHRKQIDRCSRIRSDFGDNCMKPVINMLLRIALHMQKGLYLAGLDKARAILERFMQDLDDGTTRWFNPTMKLAWGPWFAQTDADAKQTSETVRADYQAKLITRQTAIQKLAPYYGIKDATQYLDALEDEDESTAAATAALMKAAGMLGTAPGEGKPETDAEDDDAEPASAKVPVAKKAPPVKAPKALAERGKLRKRMKAAA